MGREAEYSTRPPGLDNGRYRLLVNSDNKGVPGIGAGAPKLTLVTTVCGPGSCPTVYRTDRNTLVVQGYTVASDSVDIDVPAGEQLVEIPVELLEAAMRITE